ncbi:MAG TPA: EspA/EspE family type VII secretion system effector, partial [Asanoa sp.]|nr:EspA/EspE family type VII secretion system effector [Asanoa sp.]
MGLLDKLENAGKALWDTGKEGIERVGSLRAANGPILDGGQLVIARMKLTTGLGAPEDGERFGRGGARLHDASATLRSAQPTASWMGAGADSYSVQNVEQMDRSRAMA